jgi:hypothetical protein
LRGRGGQSCLSPATMEWGHPQPRSGVGDAQRDEEKPGNPA